MVSGHEQSRQIDEEIPIDVASSGREDEANRGGQ
jgi:hypothetical protein